jgi:phenylalanine-4-hydroxylase
MRTRYIISNFQQTYFVIQSFAQLLADCGQDFGPVYDRLCRIDDIEPHELTPGDQTVILLQQ